MYRTSKKIFISGLLILSILRIVLKCLYIDMETGFYPMGFNWVVTAFNILLLLATLGITATTLTKKDTSPATFKGSRLVEVSTIFLGILISAISVPRLLQSLNISADTVSVNALSPTISIIINATGIAAGVCLIIAFLMLGDTRNSNLYGLLALPLVLWITLEMIERFISFQQVNTASDQFIETIHLVCATLFLYYVAKSMVGVYTKKSLCIFLGFLTSLFGFILVAGQLFATTLIGKTAGPPTLQMMIIFVISLYAMALSLFMAKDNS